MVLDPEDKSPWSTPTESEICEAAQKSSKQKDAAFKELGLKVDEAFNKKSKPKKQTMTSLKDPSKKDLPSSPKKRSKKGAGNKNEITTNKQKEHVEVDNTNSDAKDSNSLTNGNHITDITIPNVIPPPIEADDDRNNSHNDTNMEGEEAEITGISERRNSKVQENEETPASPTKRKSIKTSDKKSPIKKKGAAKNEDKRSRSISPAKSVGKANAKQEDNTEHKNSEIPETLGSPSSRTSADSLKLGADYTNINGEPNNESGSGSGDTKVIANGDSNNNDKGENDLDRKASPKKRKSKANTSLRRESATVVQSRSSSPKKSIAQKNLKGDTKSKTIPLSGDAKSPKWSKEIKALEGPDLSYYTESTSAAGAEEGEINNESGNSKSSIEKEYKEKKKALKELASKTKKVSSKGSPKKVPSNESPKKSPPKSPAKSPTKSPRKKLKDVLQLPFPYDEMTSGKLRIWENQSKNGEKIDDDKYPEYEKIRWAG